MDMFQNSRGESCPILCVTKAILFALVAIFILYLPLGDPAVQCNPECEGRLLGLCCFCDIYRTAVKITNNAKEIGEQLFCMLQNMLYQLKFKFYGMLNKMDRNDLCRTITCSDSALANTLEIVKEDVDNIIEDEITRKLGEDLLQSIERKFQVDLERSVEMAVTKIKLLLQNGTQHIQERLSDIQDSLDVIRSQADDEEQVDKCLNNQQNLTSSLAEKALHQMVVCGYALIGQDPAQAVTKVMILKNMIKLGVKPLREQKKEIYKILKVCGHEHDALKKVIKCVISKSPLIKSTMMEVSEKLIAGVVDLTKLMAHGAMHEACLIEVTKATEDEAFTIIDEVKKCSLGNTTELQNFILQNNATVLNTGDGSKNNSGNTVKDMKEIIRRMLEGDADLNKQFKDKLYKLQDDLNSVDANSKIADVTNELKNMK